MESTKSIIQSVDNEIDMRSNPLLSHSSLSDESKVWGRLISTNDDYHNYSLKTNVVMFGRCESSHVKLDSQFVSNKHCQLVRTFSNICGSRPVAEYWIFDFSTNGTFIQDQNIGKITMIGKNNKIEILNGIEIILVLRTHDTAKISYIFYIMEDVILEMAPTNNVVIVFTDIQSSTALWEHDTDAMSEALTTHDLLLRCNLKKYRGYEVKVEGDAFFVVFFSAIDACKWCLAIQYELLNIKWSKRLLEHKIASLENDTKSNTIFKGLRVRMGIHFGHPFIRRNSVTQRMDYYGPDINLTARISDSAHGGQILLTEAMIKALNKEFIEDSQMNHFVIQLFTSSISLCFIGQYLFKGIKSPVKVYQLNSLGLLSRNFGPLRKTVYDDNQDKETGIFMPSRRFTRCIRMVQEAASNKKDIYLLPTSRIRHSFKFPNDNESKKTNEKSKYNILNNNNRDAEKPLSKNDINQNQA